MLSRALITLSLGLASVLAKPCTVFDSNWNLYVFGLSQDVGLGPSSGWSASPLQTTTLSTTGRPPFDGANTQCFLSQYQNAAYFLNADNSQPSNVHIFNFASQSWSTQKVSADGTDPTTLDAILDRDTNVFYGLSGSQLYSLDMGTLAQSDGTTRGWQFVQNPPWTQNGAYPNPVIALAQNHIHFLDVGTPGQAAIFVIHFSYSQPDYQEYPPVENGGQAFPSSPGKATSIFKGDDAVQTKFVYIPDDGRQTYVVDVTVNNTQTLAPPTDKRVASLSAGQHEIVQMTPSGDVWWFPYNTENWQANYGNSWSKINLGLSAPSSGTTSGGSGGSGGNSGTGSGSSGGSNSNVTIDSGSNGSSTRTGTASTSTNTNGSNNAAHGRFSLDGLLLGATVTLLGFAGLFSSF